MRPERALPVDHEMTCGLLLHSSHRQPSSLDGLERPSGRTLTRGVTPSTIMSPDPRRSADRDKAGRQRAPLPHLEQEAMPMT